MSTIYENDYQIVRMLRLHGTEHAYIVLRIRIANFDVDREITFSLADIKSGKFLSELPESFAMGAKKQIQTDVNTALMCMLPQTAFQQGFTRTNDRWIYTLGDCILNGKDMSAYAINPESLHIDRSNLPTDSVASIFRWVELFCSQGSAQSALLLCALSPLTYPISDLMLLPAHVVNAYILGTSGVGKTEYAKLVTTFGNGTTMQGTNLSNDKIEILNSLSRCPDRPMLIDDLNCSSSVREIEKKKCRLSEILQLSHSGGITSADNLSVNISRTALVITGEYLLPAPSSINRCLVIHMGENLNTEALTYLQREQYQYTYLIALFAEFICTHANRLTRELRQCFFHGDLDWKGTQEESTQYIGFHRVMCSYKLLRCTQYLLLSFFEAYGMSREALAYSKLQSCLNQSIQQTVKDTLEHIKRPENILSPILKEVIDIFAFDRNGIVSKNYDDFQTLPAQVIFRNKNFFYFPGELLAGYLCGMTQTDVSNKALISELKKALLLTPYGQEWSSKLSPKIEKKKKAKGRFFRIHVDTIVHRVRETYPNTAFFTSPVKELRPSAKK